MQMGVILESSNHAWSLEERGKQIRRVLGAEFLTKKHSDLNVQSVTVRIIMVHTTCNYPADGFLGLFTFTFPMNAAMAVPTR